MYFVSINAGAQVAIILLACGPCVVIVNCWNMFCTMDRAPRTKETLPDLREWYRITQHPRVFRGLTGCQRDPRFWGVIAINLNIASSVKAFNEFDYIFTYHPLKLLMNLIIYLYEMYY